MTLPGQSAITSYTLGQLQASSVDFSLAKRSLSISALRHLLTKSILLALRSDTKVIV